MHIRVLEKDFEFNDEDLKSILKTTDIKAGKYEGGLKVWECAIDLSQCIISAFSDPAFSDHQKLSNFVEAVSCNQTMNVLELGCGHSLPLITFTKLLSQSAWKEISESKQSSDAVDGMNESKHSSDDKLRVALCLQNLDPLVLEHISVPNVWINCKQWLKSSVCESLNAVSGDWRDIKLIQSLLNVVQKERKYDVIFASETIYKESMIDTFLNLLSNLMAKPNGMCFVSAKSYYLGDGLGGGTQTLKLMMQGIKECPFTVDTVHRTEDNFRETLVLKWKESCSWDIGDFFDILEEDEEADDEEEECEFREMEQDHVESGNEEEIDEDIDLL